MPRAVEFANTAYKFPEILSLVSAELYAKQRSYKRLIFRTLLLGHVEDIVGIVKYLMSVVAPITQLPPGNVQTPVVLCFRALNERDTT